MDPAKARDWLDRWAKNITGDAKNRYCDKAMGEDIGWLMTPFLDGFYYGYLVTEDTKWIDMLADWADSWIKRAVKEPDAHIGWPAPGAAGTDVDQLNQFNADSFLGEAMALRPIVLMAGEILKSPKLKDKYGPRAQAWIKLAEVIYDKWDKRGGWRETAGGGMISVTLPFGIDAKTGKWTDGYATRGAPGHGFSHPDNKANLVACWLLAMSDVTGKAVYRERAEKWFRLMKSRMKLKDGGTYVVWNYWQPAGPWDHKADGSPKHWVGVHPNAGYYETDLAAIVDAWRHGLVFTRADIDRLVATALAEKRYWTALAPYSAAIQKEFEAAHKPDAWGGLGLTPEYLSLQAKLPARDDSAPAVSGKAGFFGIPTSGRRIAFVIDRSGGLVDTIEDIKKWLKRSIEGLRPDQRFDVIFWSTGPAVEMPGGMVEATPANKGAAWEFIRAIVPVGQTDPSDGIKTAFKVQADEVFLLTQGEWDRKIPDLVARLNADGKVVVNTVCIVYMGGEPLLKKIAEENNGRYAYVGEEDLRKAGP